MNRRKKLKTKNLPITLAYVISKGLATAIEEDFEIPKDIIELIYNKGTRLINIEICKSEHKVGTWNMRIGDIEGAINVYNMYKKDILDLISEEM